MIDLKDVSYSYENIKALVGVDLFISPGEAVAFIGPNGSDKSTMMKLINGLVYPTKGKYFLNGEEINMSKMKADRFSKTFHKQIGFVFQNSETQLFCSTVYEEIAFGPRQMGMKEDDIVRRVGDILKLLNIEELKDRQPYHLSGGEKRKVAIGAVLSLNPEVLVLDEPMNGLDPKTKRFLKELLINLNNAGKTIICSTHDFEYVEGVFRRAVVFSSDHRIIKDDIYEKVLADKSFLFENNII